MTKSYTPKHLIIEESVRDEPLTQTVIKNLPSLTPQYFSGPLESQFSYLSDKQGKEVLVLARQKGRFLKECPGSKDSLCCGYFILESASNCNYECTYCVLQSYLNSPPLIIYANLNDMFRELEGIFSTNRKIQFRIGTGELSDSLSHDHITEFSKHIVPFFSQTERACIELKTKSAQIENLKDLDHRGRTIVSWSLNTKKMSRQEELRAPGIEERLEAARICQEWGYPLSFHLEPLLYYPEWEEDYQELVRDLFRSIRPEQIKWISLGGLRLLGNLKEIAQEKFPKSTYLYEEFIPGTDGKLKYLKLIRLQMYQKISKMIQKQGGRVPIYLCMESSEVWRKGLGYDFADTQGADDYLSRSVFESEP